MHSPLDREEFQAPLAEINMTPLVDVMLVLVVIFLVTAPMLTNAVSLKLPNESARQISQEKATSISIDGKGNYYLDDHEVSEDELEAILEGIAKTHQKRQIHLRADKDVSYGKVSHVLALAQRFGLNDIGFVTEPK